MLSRKPSKAPSRRRLLADPASVPAVAQISIDTADHADHAQAFCTEDPVSSGRVTCWFVL